MLYIAYLGGSGNDFPTAIAVDRAGSAFIAGYTNSVDLLTANALQSEHAGADCVSSGGSRPCFDVFVAKLNPAGSAWTYATYMGGSGDDLAQALLVDETGNAVIAGTTTSEDFPVLHAFQTGWAGGTTESFVAKIDAAGSRLIFASLLGGSRDDFATSLALGGADEIYVAGYTNSPDLASSPGLQPGYADRTCGALASTFPCFDAFAAKITPDGAGLGFLTYLGGSGGDYATGIAVDPLGRATIAGSTTSQDFPVTFGAFQTAGGGNNTDAFVTRLDPSGHALAYSTYLGGDGADSAAGLVVDSGGRTIIAGTTWGSGFPAVNPIEAGSGGFYDVFLAVLNDSGTALEFSTRLGGTGHEKAHGVAWDAFANVYIAAETFSTDYPTVRALQPQYAGGGFDGAIAKIALGPSARLYSSTSRLDFGPQLVGTRSSARIVSLANVGGGELNIESVTPAGDFETVSDCTKLAPGAACDLLLAFAPTSEGSRMGTVSIQHDGPGGVLLIDLGGIGTAPEILLSAGSIAFNPQLVGTDSEPQVIALTNPGAATLELIGISVTGDFAQSNDCPSMVRAGEGCTIRVVFSPTAAGHHEGALSVVNHLPEETKQAVLIGMGSDFSLVASSADVTVAAGDAATFTLTLTPVGGFRESLAIACTGAPPGANCTLSQPQLSLEGSSAAEVKVTITTTVRSTIAPIDRRIDWPILLSVLVLSFALSLARQTTSIFTPPARLSRAFSTVIACLCFMAACGGGGGITQPQSAALGTPAGSYTLTMTATCGNVSRVSFITLVVR